MADTNTLKPAPNQRLRHERDRRCWSQQELADKVGTTPLNIGRWERGITFPNPYFRQKLCEVFEKSPQELGLVPEEADENKSAGASKPSDAPIATSLWNVPYRRNPLFTGREDILTQLRSTLTSEEQPIAITQPQAISGLGGIGKTQTAVEYAYRYRDTYDAGFWVRAESADLLISDFLLIAALLHLPERNEQDQNLVVNAVKRWFDTHQHWLLILDNADDVELASDFIPSAGKGHVLLTTRAQALGTVAQRIELEKMGRDEGTLFLLRRAKVLKGNASLESASVAVRSQAQAIVEALDGLPLALDQAGAYIEETGCSLSDYLKFYKMRRNRLLRTRGRDATGHPEPVATTWSLSFEKVERTNPAAAELLRLCAFLHPDEIPEAMITEGASELGPILQAVAEDDLELNEAIGELLKYSLVRRNPETKILNIHRLVQAALKDAMSKEVQRAWVDQTVHVINQAFPDAEEVTTWPKCQQYLPHAQTCAELIEQWNLISLEAARLLNHAGSYLRTRGQYMKAEPLLQHALSIRENVLEPEHLDLATSLNNLAEIYHKQGKYDQAQLLHQRTLSIREKLLGPEHPKVAESLRSLGRLRYRQGKYAEAEAFWQRALAVWENILGGEHPEAAHCLRNLAVLYQMYGKYSHAEQFLQRALAINEKVLGPEHPNMASVLTNLAGLYQDQGKHAEAEIFYRRSLVICEKVLGSEYPVIADNLYGLALLHQERGEHIQTEQLLQRALTIYEQTSGPASPYVAYVLNDLALLYCGQSLYEQAESHLQRALSIQEQKLGPLHPDIAITLENYANLLHKTGRENEAATLETRAHKIRAQQEKRFSIF